MGLRAYGLGFGSQRGFGFWGLGRFGPEAGFVASGFRAKGLGVAVLLPLPGALVKPLCLLLPVITEIEASKHS